MIFCTLDVRIIIVADYFVRCCIFRYTHHALFRKSLTGA